MPRACSPGPLPVAWLDCCTGVPVVSCFWPSGSTQAVPAPPRFPTVRVTGCLSHLFPGPEREGEPS